MKYFYDISNFVGVLLVTAGVWVEFGLGYALMTAGATVSVLSIFAGLSDVSKQNQS